MYKKEYSSQRVIVIGGDHHNTLGVIRALGLSGISPILILITETKFASVGKSKYIDECFFVRENEKEIINALKKCKSISGKPVVIPTSDYAALLLDRKYNELKNDFYLPNINDCQGDIEKYMDKYAQYLFARRNGIKMPETHKLDLSRGLNFETIKRYPYILKPLMSAINGSKDNMKICHNKSELTEWIRYLETRGFKTLLLQEYIDYDFEIDVPVCSVGKNVIIPAVMRKIRRSPVGYGTTSFAEILNVPDGLIWLKDFIRKLNISALFDLEIFCRGNEYYLCEINFRNSGTSYAYIYDDINLPLLYVLLISGKKIDNLRTVISRKKMFLRDENGERRLLMKHNIRLKDYIFAQRSSFGLVFDRRDVKPDIYRWIYAVMRRLFRRR